MSNIEKQVLDLGPLPTKGIDYWTPEEEAEMNNAKNGALVAAQEARTAKQETDAATGRANEAATNANGAAGVALEEAGKAGRSAKNADDATVNANRAAADANRAYNTVTNYHDAVTAPDHNRAEQDHTRSEQDHTRHVEDHQEAVSQRAAEAAEFQRTQQAKQTEFARTEKARQDEFYSKEEHRDWANAEAVTFADNMADVNRDMGKYQQLPDVTLTLVESGKRIDKDGKFVSDTSWSIGRLGAVSKGNIYELLMGGSDKMVLGTALFVSHTIERFGGQDKDVYKPIFSAVNVDLPISTYAVLLVGEDYSDVLVSYRNDVAGASVLKVARWGIFASIATQLANLRGDVDLKSFSDGYYDNMGVGFAKNLIGDGEATHEEFAERVAGGSHQIDDALAEYVTIKGNSAVKNQIIKNSKLQSTANWNMSQTTNEIVDGVMKVTINQQYTTSGIKQSFVANDGDIILRVCCVRSDESVHVYMGSTYTNIRFDITNQFKDIYYISQHSARENHNDLCISGGVIGTTNTYYIKYAFAVNLSKWYNGAVPEGLTAEQFVAMNPDVLTMPYTEPHVVNMTAEGVKTTGRNLWDEEWEVGRIDPDSGANIADYTTIRSKNFIGVSASKDYYIKANQPSVVVCYDSNKNSLGWIVYGGANGQEFTTKPNTAYVKFCLYANSGTTYHNDICINISDPSFNGQYEPHVTSERKWTETMKKCFPEGLAKAGNVYDEFGATKAVQRIGVVDLGSLSWIRFEQEGVYIFDASIPNGPIGNARPAFSPAFQCNVGSSISWLDLPDKIGQTRTGGIRVRCDAYTDVDSFKTAMQGVLLYYELDKPIVTTYDELNLTSRVWRNGMEKIIVPEGKESSPISADVIYQINAFKTIKANKQGVEDLNAKPAISLTAEEVAKLRALINTNTQNLEE